MKKAPTICFKFTFARPLCVHGFAQEFSISIFSCSHFACTLKSRLPTEKVRQRESERKKKHIKNKYGQRQTARSLISAVRGTKSSGGLLLVDASAAHFR